MKIGILQTGMAPPEMVERHGEYPDMFERFLGAHGFDFKTYNVLTHDIPSNPQDTDGWLITGSKHGVYEDHPWIAPLEDLVRRIYTAKIPLLGVCFGHQIIAQALGGTVVKFNGGWSVGHTEYTLNGHKDPVMLNAWHQDQVIDLPKDARVIGSSDFCKYAALAYGDKVLTVQPHPEFNDNFVADLIKYRAPGVVPDDLQKDAINNMGRPTQNEMIADMFANILKQPKTEGDAL